MQKHDFHNKYLVSVYIYITIPRYGAMTSQMSNVRVQIQLCRQQQQQQQNPVYSPTGNLVSGQSQSTTGYNKNIHLLRLNNILMYVQFKLKELLCVKNTQ